MSAWEVVQARSGRHAESVDAADIDPGGKHGAPSWQQVSNWGCDSLATTCYTDAPHDGLGVTAACTAAR